MTTWKPPPAVSGIALIIRLMAETGIRSAELCECSDSAYNLSPCEGGAFGRHASSADKAARIVIRECEWVLPTSSG